MKITRYPQTFGDYRYRLTVEFTEQERESNRGHLVVVMFNPATTQEKQDLIVKPRGTRNRLIKLARDGNYRTMTEVNLFAYRSPKKQQLEKTVREQDTIAVGPENNQVISEAVQEADKLIVAWGVVSQNPTLARRADEVAELLKASGKQIYCIGKNKDGSPKNPARGKHIIQAWP